MAARLPWLAVLIAVILGLSVFPRPHLGLPDATPTRVRTSPAVSPTAPPAAATVAARPP